MSFWHKPLLQPYQCTFPTRRKDHAEREAADVSSARWLKAIWFLVWSAEDTWSVQSNKVVDQWRATESWDRPSTVCPAARAVTVYTPLCLPPSLLHSLPSSLPSSVQPGAVWKNMHIVAKVQGFLPPTHTRHWLPLYPAPWEENTLGMNCAWLPTGWMLPLCAKRGGPGGCGWFL